jgi:3-hydroxyacyl-CoA dehydrogenase/3a,7a,12a-trihydroxy-5b-cholest-24-enoyl-CoA hydratase
VGKVGTTFQFSLKGPDSAWLVDVKNGKGSVTAGAGDKPDVTLELTDADFLDMTSGKADPQKLYFAGKLKISGNVMASQKLMFLKEVKPEQALEAIQKARGGGPLRERAAPAAVAGSKEPVAPRVFKALEERVAKNGGLVKEVTAVIRFRIKAPDATWTVDLKEGRGSVKAGETGQPDTMVTIDDSDLAELVSGKESAQALFQRGKLRIDGDVRVAHRLGFLNKLI